MKPLIARLLHRTGARLPHTRLILAAGAWALSWLLASAVETAPPTTNAAPSAAAAPAPAPDNTPHELKPGELRLNFRNAPIDLVLNYLSDAAGFIIQLNTPVRGKLDVWSSQPVTRDEAVDILNGVLNRNGYAAVRNGRQLTVMSREDALRADIPVRVSTDPQSIPKSDEIATLIIPVRFVEAEQLLKDISPLVSPHATVLANAAGNSIVVTDTQANIHHLAEIIKAIDTGAEDVTEVRVYHLSHHDPQEIAMLLNNLYSDSSGSTAAQAPFRFGGIGALFGNRGMGNPSAQANAAGGSSQTDRIKKRTRVTAVADPRTASVVVSASRDMSEQIGRMIEQLDQESPKVAHVSVIHLENADPQQVQQVLQDMFQNTTGARSTTQTSPLQNRVQQSTSSSSSSSGLTGSGMGNPRSGSSVPSF